MNLGKTYRLKTLVWDRPGLVLDSVFKNEISVVCLDDERLPNCAWQAKQHWDTKDKLRSMLGNVVRKGVLL